MTLKLAGVDGVFETVLVAAATQRIDRIALHWESVDGAPIGEILVDEVRLTINGGDGQ